MNPSSNSAISAKSRAWRWVPSLYFVEGLPYVAVNTLSMAVFTDMGIDNARMTFYTSLLNLPWVLKFFWSPFIDLMRTKRWWIVTMEAVLAVLMGLVALFLPTSMFFSALLAVFFVAAFASATHDIAADGFYMLALDSNTQSFFVGVRSTFYRFAMIFGQGALVAFAGWLDTHVTGAVDRSWMVVFGIVGAMLALAALYHAAVLPRPADDRLHATTTPREIVDGFGETFSTFFKKKGVWIAITFMLLYRLPEALMLKLVYPFLTGSAASGGLQMSKEAYGLAYGTLGVAGLLLGGIAGGIVAARDGLKRWIRPMAWAMSLSCLTFLLLSYLTNPSIWVVSCCIFVEQFGYGFGFAAYMLYLLYFAQGRYATSHYAFCTGFMAASIMLPGLVAGKLQELLGYQHFFMLCIVCCVATIVVASVVKIDSNFGKKSTQ